MRVRPLTAVLLVLGLAPRLAGQEVFQVNTYTEDRQGDPAVSVDAAGGFVVVWESTGQDGDYYGVFAQRYAAGGARMGTEFQVNAYTFGAQRSPSVATLGGGDFVVVWDGYGEGGDFGDIFARRFAAGGEPAGSEFQVNQPGLAYETAAAVAATSDGGFVVVWDDYSDVFVRRYDASGAPLAGAVRVNESEVGTQNGAAVAGLPSGGFVVAWGDGYYLSDGQDGFGYGVFGRRFGAQGQPLGSEFQINTATLGDQYGPAIAVEPDGGFVVVWQSFDDLGIESAIVGRRFDSAGAALGGELAIDSTTLEDQYSVAIAADAAGAFVVAWASAPRDGSAPVGVLLRRFDSAGTPVGGSEPVQSAAVAVPPEEVAVGALATGAAVVLWRDDLFDTSDAAVLARIVSGTPGTASPTPVASPTAPPSPTAVATTTAVATPTGVSTATASPSPQSTAASTPSRTATGSVTATATTELAAFTPTASLTASAPETSTPTSLPSQTSTAPATPTPSVATCAGDCNDNGAVTVDDLILAVNIALGIQPVERCAAADRDADGQVGVAELVLAVNRALGGCG